MLLLQVGAGSMLAFGTGCRALSIFSPIPDTRTAADRAHEFDQRCARIVDASVTEILPQSAIDVVEPAYSYVRSGPNSPEARLRGARFHIRPLPGFAKESLTRRFECHEARALLGATPSPDDPLVLTDRWLDIDVDSEGDGFIVSVRVDSFEDARAVLGRARGYAGARPGP